MRHVERASYPLCWETKNSVLVAVKMSNNGLGHEEEEEEKEERKVEGNNLNYYEAKRHLQTISIFVKFTSTLHFTAHTSCLSC